MQVLLSKNVGDDNVEGQTRHRDARLRVKVPLSLARACLDAARRLGDHRVQYRVHCARRCALCVPLDLRREHVVSSDVTTTDSFRADGTAGRLQTESFLKPALATPDHSRRRAGTAFLYAHSASAMSGAQYERRDDSFRDDRRDREWYVPREHHRRAREKSNHPARSAAVSFHPRDGQRRGPAYLSLHETRATRTETFATLIAELSLPPTFHVHPSPQGPEGR